MIKKLRLHSCLGTNAQAPGLDSILPTAGLSEDRGDGYSLHLVDDMPCQRRVIEIDSFPTGVTSFKFRNGMSFGLI